MSMEKICRVTCDAGSCRKHEDMDHEETSYTFEQRRRYEGWVHLTPRQLKEPSHGAMDFCPKHADKAKEFKK